MNQPFSAVAVRRAFQLTLLALLSLAVSNRSNPQQLSAKSIFATPQAGVRSSEQHATVPEPLTSGSAALPALLSPSVDPFAALADEVAAGRSVTTVMFGRTNLDTRAEATAQVAMRNQTLLVRMRAKNMPLPAYFDVPRYALWVYVPNYRIKLYIGDLPITPTSKERGDSDSAYRFPMLPPDAVFGGLILTAEPPRYTPIVNEALRPVLIALTAGTSIEDASAAKPLYAKPVSTLLVK